MKLSRPQWNGSGGTGVVHRAIVGYRIVPSIQQRATPWSAISTCAPQPVQHPALLGGQQHAGSYRAEPGSDSAEALGTDALRPLG